MRRVLLRADGNNKIGTGHLHRIFALAQMLESKFECLILIQSPSADTLNLFQGKFQIINLNTTGKGTPEFYDELIPFTLENDIVVLDGYHFDTLYQQRVKQRCYRLVSIDDIHEHHFVSDLIINHSGGITPDLYSAESYTRLALGPKFCLIKNEFLAGEKRQKFHYPPALFINCGGADPFNHTQLILKKVQELRLSFSIIHVVLGAANVFRSDIEEIADKWHSGKIKIHFGISYHEMKDLMKECDVAILSPSTVLFEYSNIGGLIFLVQIAENQKDVFDYFITNKLAFDFLAMNDILKNFASFNRIVKKSLHKQSLLFDQRSGKRVLDLFLNL